MKRMTLGGWLLKMGSLIRIHPPERHSFLRERSILDSFPPKAELRVLTSTLLNPPAQWNTAHCLCPFHTVYHMHIHMSMMHICHDRASLGVPVLQNITIKCGIETELLHTMGNRLSCRKKKKGYIIKSRRFLTSLF